MAPNLHQCIKRQLLTLLKRRKPCEAIELKTDQADVPTARHYVTTARHYL